MEKNKEIRTQCERLQQVIDTITGIPLVKKNAELLKATRELRKIKSQLPPFENGGL